MDNFVKYIISLLLLLTPFSYVKAAELPNKDALYSYHGPQIQLRNTLEIFAENIGVPIIISDKIDARVDTTLPLSSRRNFLDKLAIRYRFVWYFDGGVLYVTNLSELETNTIKLDAWSAHEMTRELKAAGLWDDRFIRTGGPMSQLLIVTAPPPFIRMLEKVVSDVDNSARRKINIIGIIEEKPTIPSVASPPEEGDDVEKKLTEITE